MCLLIYCFFSDDEFEKEEINSIGSDGSDGDVSNESSEEESEVSETSVEESSSSDSDAESDTSDSDEGGDSQPCFEELERMRALLNASRYSDYSNSVSEGQANDKIGRIRLMRNKMLELENKVNNVICFRYL